jgi:hypothetical protein
MPTIVWALIWIAVIAVVALLVVREVRSGRKQPDDFDRTQHEAVRMSETDRATHGPNNTQQIGFGG